MSIIVKKYNSSYFEVWDNFIDTSNNGTIFNSRKFLNYHINKKFVDHSLIFEKNNEVLAVLSAALVVQKNERALISHPGASFGSLVYKKSLSFKETIEITKLLKNYAKKNNFNKIFITFAPSVYSALNSDYFEYSLYCIGAEIQKLEMSSIVNFHQSYEVVKRNIKPSHLQAARKAEKNGIRIKISKNYKDFYSILLDNLELRHEVNPTHSLQELEKLVGIFSEQIILFSAYNNDKMIAGVVNFICNNNTVLAFYICQNYKFQKFRPLNLLFTHIFKWAINKGFKHYDFGLFTDDGTPNYGLAKYKENYGAKGYFRKSLKVNI